MSLHIPLKSFWWKKTFLKWGTTFLGFQQFSHPSLVSCSQVLKCVTLCRQYVLILLWIILQNTCCGYEQSGGYEVDLFVETPDYDLICIICRGVLRCPVRVACNHIFCKRCILQWLKRYTQNWLQFFFHAEKSSWKSPYTGIWFWLVYDGPTSQTIKNHPKTPTAGSPGPGSTSMSSLTNWTLMK